jgi:hypothetical protein
MSDRRPGNPLQRLPLPAFFVVVALLWVTLQTVFSTEPVDAISITTHAIGGLLFATVLTVIIGLRRRRLGGADAAVEFLRAVRAGMVPEGVDAPRWISELDRTAVATRRQRWFIRIGGLLPFGLGVWGTTDPDARVLGIVLVVGMVAGWIVGEISSRRQLARIDRMRADLTERR